MKIDCCCAAWEDGQYELIDSGDGMKLERFGGQLLSRPEPQAIWHPSLSAAQWRDMADATFVKTGGEDKGEWNIGAKTEQQWWIKRGAVNMRLGLTAFKHVGIFPEQASNWDFMTMQLKKFDNPEVLNMFAYTGGASIAAAAAGARVTHVDSVKVVNSWARENGERSGYDNIRYITDDATKFISREVRRERHYKAIILDPPAYGRGPDGEKWILEQHITSLLEDCAKILSPEEGSFLILNLYSVGFSPILASTLLESIFGSGFSYESGELFAVDSFGKRLPLGLYCRVVSR